jgi:Zn ribbon nucleic-acid-binding protein
MYCENCTKADTGVIWVPDKKENCLNCGKEMIRAPPDTYTVVFGFCYGCLQTEHGLAMLPVTLDDEKFIIGSNCPNCHKIGLMKYTRDVDSKYRKYAGGST